MRTNMFGDPYISPADDLGTIFAERGWEDGPYTLRFIDKAEDGDITPGWLGDIADQSGEDIAHLEGFASRDELVAYASSFGLTIED